MSKSIPLSPNHGVNPTIPLCFFCGEQKNEIALLGKLPGDIEAPKNLLLDYNPCDKCLEIMKDNVTLIEVTNSPTNDNQPPIQGDLYPTGKYVVITYEAAERCFTKKESIKKGSTILVDPEIMTNFIP